MRRMFRLPEPDEEFLNSSSLQWETIKDGRANWLLIHHFPVAEGYNHQVVSVALLICPGYPAVQIDMAYFSPHLTRLDGKQIRALALQTIDGRFFQRWSRHRTGENPWRVGVDDVSTHLELVKNWFKREITSK